MELANLMYGCCMVLGLYKYKKNHIFNLICAGLLQSNWNFRQKSLFMKLLNHHCKHMNTNAHALPSGIPQRSPGPERQDEHQATYIFWLQPWWLILTSFDAILRPNSCYNSLLWSLYCNDFRIWTSKRTAQHLQNARLTAFHSQSAKPGKANSEW